MNIFRRIHTRYILHRHAIAHDLWAEVAGKLASLQGMTAVEKAGFPLKPGHLTISKGYE